MAEGDTRARIAKGDWTVRAPKGWKYAEGADFTVAAAERAMFAMTTFDEPEKKKQDAKRDAALGEVMEKLAVTFPKKKKVVFPRKVDKTLVVGELKVGLVQLDGAKSQKKRGPVLAFSARLPDGKVLLGAAFVPDDDKSNADAAILASIESIARAETAPSKVDAEPAPGPGATP